MFVRLYSSVIKKHDCNGIACFNTLIIYQHKQLVMFRMFNTTEPTDWVSSMVTVVRNGKLRICSDPKDLNKAIRREHYPFPIVEEVVASMPGAKVFSKIDAKSGFLQIKLDYESSLLTTFNSPIGRYRWLRLPFAIKSAPEIYQRIMDEMLEDIDGARAIMDDILIAGKTHKNMTG